MKAMTAWADALDQGEPMLPWMPLVLLDRAVELDGEEAALRVADHLAQVEELDLTVKALRLLGEHDLRPWPVEVAVRVLVGESHLPFVSPMVVMRVVAAAEGGRVDQAAVLRLLTGHRKIGSNVPLEGEAPILPDFVEG